MSTPHPTIFLDDCGFTGEDLADPDQPNSVVASHDLSEVDAASLKREHFGHVKADELKHSSLQRRRAHQEAVVAFLTSVLTADRARVSIAHKQYALVATIVELVIETVMHADGIDLYDRGGNDALSNVLYFSLLARSQALVMDVGRKFQRAVRMRTPDHIEECCRVLTSREVDAALEGLPPIFAPVLRRFGTDGFAELTEHALDLSLPFALHQCWAWRSREIGPFRIVHDRSSTMAKSKWLWDAIVAPDVPAALVGRGSFAVRYPLGVLETRFEDSKLSAALQLADVLAGAFARWATWLARERPAADTYAAALHEVFEPVLQPAIVGIVWPFPSVEPSAPSPPDVEDPNEFLAAVIRRTRGEAR
jgi:hypothetical protein